MSQTSFALPSRLYIQLVAQLPGLSSLSMARALVSEVDPVFFDPALAEQRLKTPEQVKRHLSTLRKKMKDAAEDAEEEEGEDAAVGSDGDSDDEAVGGGAGGAGSARVTKAPVSAKERRHRTQVLRFGYLGEPPHTSVAGWISLMRAPRGLFSLDVIGNDLSYDSYALLRLHVGELRADKVKSPEEEAVAAERRGSAAVKREEKKRRVADAAAAVPAGGVANGAQGAAAQ